MKRAAGFTLLEVLVSVAILTFVMAGISTVLVKQSQLSEKQSQERDMEQSGRLALMDLARAVRLAGYGINPLAAFDFDRFACTSPGTASSCPNGGRDRIDGPDEVVMAWRDPVFYRTATGVTGSAAGPWTVTLGSALADPLNANRIVQMLCVGAEPSVYLAVNGDTAAGATSLVLRKLTAADGYFTGYLSAGGAANVAPLDGCFATAGVMLVERVRYYVANDTDGAPSLFRDRGRGAQERLYRGIEDLQLTYDIGRPPAGSAFASGGATPAAAPACGATLWTFGTCATAGTPLETAATPIWQTDNYDSVNRYSGHPVNIRTVNIYVVAATTRLSSDGTGDNVPALGNRPARAADKYHRSVLSVTETPENLLGRAHFLPPVFANSNVGGG